MKVAFLGTPAAAVPILEGLLRSEHRVGLVVTQPDRPAGRSGQPIAPAVKQAAERAGIPVIQPSKVRTPEFLAAFESERVDVLVTAAYGRILPRPVLDVAPLGALNVHFSLLPRHRGAAPVQWALAMGDEQTGATIMRMNERLDEGDILLQEALAILPDEHAPQLQHRLAEVGAALLLRALAGLQSGTLIGRAQDHAQATYAALLTRGDGEADFAWSARVLEGRVRGFDPWPGVWTENRGRRLRIRQARAIQGFTDESPGCVLGFDGGAFTVACGAGTRLAVTAIQPESGRELSADEARNGRIVSAGDRFGHSESKR